MVARSKTSDFVVSSQSMTENPKFGGSLNESLVGGDSMENQLKELALNPDIIIATPGTLMHHLSELSESRQTLLFSATMPTALAEFAKAGLRDPQLTPYKVPEIVAFNRGGMDIPLLDNVLNWDFPSNPKMFVHRVGRVARNGRAGTAYSFVTLEDIPYLLDLHIFMSKPIRPAPTEEEYLKDINQVMDKIEQAMANVVTVYGCFPQTALDLVQDKVQDGIGSSSNIQDFANEG
uniref:Helicase C-terminal domain-containing protein n=1 Tax=Chenopodium quinoa TaxID=63459 RepID=A0A803L729_CHEQI